MQTMQCGSNAGANCKHVSDQGIKPCEKSNYKARGTATELYILVSIELSEHGTVLSQAGPLR